MRGYRDIRLLGAIQGDTQLGFLTPGTRHEFLAVLRMSTTIRISTTHAPLAGTVFISNFIISDLVFGLLLSLNLLQYFFDKFCLWFVYIIVLIDGNLRQLHPQERQHSKFDNEVYMIGELVFFRPEILSTNK